MNYKPIITTATMVLCLLPHGCACEEPPGRLPYYCHLADDGWEAEVSWDYSFSLVDRSTEDWPDRADNCVNHPYNFILEGHDANGFAHQFLIYFPHDDALATVPPLAGNVEIAVRSNNDVRFWSVEVTSDEEELFLVANNFAAPGNRPIRARLGRDIGSSPNTCGIIYKKTAIIWIEEESIEVWPGYFDRLGNMVVANFDSVNFDSFACNIADSGGLTTWGAWTQ